MRNIWAIVVGVVVLGGVAVAVYEATNSGPGAEREVRIGPAPASAENGQSKAAVPKPDQTFDKVEITEDDYILGNKDAKVTVVEYASLTCPHCAAFHGDGLAKLKKEYIETGKVRLVYRDFPLDRVALAASVLAKCAPRDRYFGFVDVLFTNQATWARATDPVAALAKLGRLGGVSRQQFDTCLKNEQLQNSIVQQRMVGERSYAVNATPTIIINGQRFPGGLTFPQLKAVIDPMLANAK